MVSRFTYFHGGSNGKWEDFYKLGYRVVRVKVTPYPSKLRISANGETAANSVK
jgi:hypothetical protein